MSGDIIMRVNVCSIMCEPLLESATAKLLQGKNKGLIYICSMSLVKRAVYEALGIDHARSSSSHGQRTVSTGLEMKRTP